MNPIIINSLDDSRVAMFANMRGDNAAMHDSAYPALFIAESPKVINVALSAGYKPVALLCEPKHIEGDAAQIIASQPHMQVFTGSRDVLAGLTGYKLTRGVLCAMERPVLPTIATVLNSASRVAIIDQVCDTTNIGSIFRAAAALGIDGVLVSRGSCDPLNRRAVRVSMGSVFLIPWTWIDYPLSRIHEYGFKTVALALRPDAVPIDDASLMAEPKLALILGTEGEGLADKVIEDADYKAIIPMCHGVDSLNVAAAASVAFWQLRKSSNE